jgi:hypothetical protein
VTALRKEVLLLITVVLGIDALFVAIYFTARIRYAPDLAKVVFTGVWTLAVLVVAIRSLAKIRRARLQQQQH